MRYRCGGKPFSIYLSYMTFSFLDCRKPSGVGLKPDLQNRKPMCGLDTFVFLLHDDKSALNPWKGPSFM